MTDVRLPKDAGHEAVGQALMIAGIGVGTLAGAAGIGQVIAHNLSTLLVALS